MAAAASAAPASSSAPDAKVTHEDTAYLERRGVCETVDAMLQAACAARAPDPAAMFLTSMLEQTSVSNITRVQSDVPRDDKLTKSKAWKDLQKETFSMPATTGALFGGNANRAEDFSTQVALDGDSNVDGSKNFFFADFSKNYITQAARQQLINVATHRNLQAAMDSMFAGNKVNATEKRSAFHIALRGSGSADATEGGKKVSELVAAELNKMSKIAGAIRDGKTWVGATGKPIASVVHIGIGGSVLGTQAAVEALAPFNNGKTIKSHFISSLDGAQLQTVLAAVDLETTVFVIAGKTFTTQETMTVADEAKKAVVAKMNAQAVAKHFIAATAAPERATAWGISADNVIQFWDFVGGRYSVWSGVGVTLAIACGFQSFEQFLAGAKAMDTHFFETKDWTKNVPVMMGLLSVFTHNLLAYQAHAVVPYSSRLGLVPSWLQQLEMESNGKSITAETNKGVEVRTSPIVLGGSGPEAQHSFFQLLHQGTSNVSVDFIGAAQAQTAAENGNQTKLMANLLAQGRAMMQGHMRHEINQELSKGNDRFSSEELNHRVLPGSKCNSTFLFKKMTPMALGALFAAYEHKVFVEGVVWGINSFDQFGVERGKKMAKSIEPGLGKNKPLVTEHDNSTNALVNLLNQHAQ